MLPTVSVRILAIDDDQIVREVVAQSLRSEGFLVAEAGNAATALQLIAVESFDLLLVDLRLPDLSGFELVQRARTVRQTAVIYLTTSQVVEDCVRGLDSGGDDFLVKPVTARELAARVRAVLRRYQRAAERGTTTAVIEFAGWTLDLVRRELADPDGNAIALTRGEFDLLAALAQSDRMPLSRDYLMEVVASHDATSNPRMIDVMVSKIRHKLRVAQQPAPAIMTVQGQGYRFQAPSR